MIYKKKKDNSRTVGKSTGKNYFCKTCRKLYGNPSLDKKNDILLSQDVFLRIDSKLVFNKNQLVIGGRESGKTSQFIIPNILQANSNMIVMDDPTGRCMKETRKAMEEKDYKIKVLNLQDLEHSDHYNPLIYLHPDAEECTAFADLILTNGTEREREESDFYHDLNRALIRSLLLYELETGKRSFSDILNMLCDELKVAAGKLDLYFYDFEKQNPDSAAVKNYKIFLHAAGPSVNSAIRKDSIFEVAMCLEPLLSMETLIKDDTMELDCLEKNKQIIYLIPSVDMKEDLLMPMLIHQVAYWFCSYDTSQKPLLPLRFYLDEFQNIGKIPNLGDFLSNVWPERVSFVITVQSISDLDYMRDYMRFGYETLIDYFSACIYMGKTFDPATISFISELMWNCTSESKIRRTRIRLKLLKKEDCIVFMQKPNILQVLVPFYLYSGQIF